MVLFWGEKKMNLLCNAILYLHLQTHCDSLEKSKLFEEAISKLFAWKQFYVHSEREQKQSSSQLARQKYTNRFWVSWSGNLFSFCTSLQWWTLTLSKDDWVHFHAARTCRNLRFMFTFAIYCFKCVFLLLSWYNISFTTPLHKREGCFNGATSCNQIARFFGQFASAAFVFLWTYCTYVT